MSRLVIDASVAIKWVVEEKGTAEALLLLERRLLSAPDLLITECANVLWKKTKRGELSEEEARLAARLIQRAEVELLPTRNLMEGALELAVALDHAAYDCVYLALALENGWPFVTADGSLIRKIAASGEESLRGLAVALGDSAALAAG